MQLLFFFGVVEGADKITVLLEKWQNLYLKTDISDNYFRNISQKWLHGIVRLNPSQEFAYNLIKSKNIELATKTIINPHTYVLDLEKFRTQLSLPVNKEQLAKLSQLDLQCLKFSSLAREDEVLRHNLTKMFCIFRREASVDDLIVFFSSSDVSLFMSEGKEAVTNSELQKDLQVLIRKISTTPEGTELMQRFISGKSQALFDILQEYKLLKNDLHQIAIERAFKETLFVEDTSAVWLTDYKNKNPISTFFGLTNEEELLCQFRDKIRQALSSLYPQNPA